MLSLNNYKVVKCPLNTATLMNKDDNNAITLYMMKIKEWGFKLLGTVSFCSTVIFHCLQYKLISKKFANEKEI